MSSINIAIVGVGNCASSLVQGLSHYRDGANETVGLMHWDLGGYRPSDIRVVAAWDVDARKVGHDVADAIFAKPNCTAIFCESIEPTGTKVQMGRILDGVADHMEDYADDRTFVVAQEREATKDEVIAALRAANIAIIINTNRDASTAPGTVATLKAAGLGDFTPGDNLFLRQGVNGKDARRAAIAQRYCVVAMAGDGDHGVGERLVPGRTGEVVVSAVDLERGAPGATIEVFCHSLEL